MKKPLLVGAHIRESAFPVLVFLIVGITAAMVGLALEGIVGIVAGVISALTMIGACAFSERTKKKLKGHGASLSDAGVSATIDGQPTWTLPWSRYGGYRHIEVNDAKRVLHPQQCGVEILNREGVAVGIINLEPASHATSLYPGGFYSLFWRILDKRATHSPKQEAPPRAYTTTSTKIGVQTLVSAVLFLSSFGLWNIHGRLVLAVENDSTIMLNPFYATGGLLFTIAGIVFVGTALRGVLFLRFPKLYRSITSLLTASKPEVETQAPADGPTYEEFLIENGGAPDPIELEEGIRYVQVDPEYRYGVDSSLLPIIVMFSICAVATLVAFFSDPSQSGPGIVTLAILALIALLFLFQRVLNQRAQAIRDTVIPIDGGLVVVRPDGSHLSFSSRAFRKMLDGMNASRWVRQEVWKEGKKKYFLDRTHLIKASVQLDHEELKDLELELRN